MSAEGWGGASHTEPDSVNNHRTDNIKTESFPREPREDVTSETRAEILQENTPDQRKDLLCLHRELPNFT